MRLFFAIELTESVRTHLRDVQGGLRDAVQAVSWTRPENLHVTLKFLGEVEETRLPPLCEDVKQIAGANPMMLRASQLLFFPPRGGARIVAAEMAGDLEPLRRLYDALEQVSASHGFAPERRRYRPHVTIARPRQFLRPPQQAQLLQRSGPWWPGPELHVAEFVLMESRLHGSRGSEYLPVARFPLMT